VRSIAGFGIFRDFLGFFGFRDFSGFGPEPAFSGPNPKKNPKPTRTVRGFPPWMQLELRSAMLPHIQKGKRLRFINSEDQWTILSTKNNTVTKLFRIQKGAGVHAEIKTVKPFDLEPDFEIL
jgi:hypothetical protein